MKNTKNLKSKMTIKIKEKKAITLVALIITIIILLILAGISIAQLTGNGLFEKAKLAKEESKNAQEDEDRKIAKYGNEINSYIDGNRDTVTISQEEYNRLIKKGTWKLITTSNKINSDSASIMSVSDLSKYSNFGLLIYYNNQYLAYTSLDYNLLKAGKNFFASYKDSSNQYYAGLKYLSDTQIKLWIDSTRSTEQAELYGIY